ncbi:MAG TPA: cytochrome c [Solirubrobacteraceae bacterium]|jgi:mono/diheme cytochrome c family protein
MRLLRATLVLGALAFSLSGCGEHGIELAKNNPDRAGAEIFFQRCSGCHTLGAAGTEGSSSAGAHSREYKDGPNFDQRAEQYEQVLYAIRNGGFSSGPMPQNIVTGREAEQVARFVSKYSGRESSSKAQSPNPGNSGPAGAGGE